MNINFKGIKADRKLLLQNLIADFFIAKLHKGLNLEQIIEKLCVHAENTSEVAAISATTTIIFSDVDVINSINN